MNIKELTPAETAHLLKTGKIKLIDVREHNEHAAERIEGAHLMPLSCFDPAQLEAPEGVELVFHCGIGKRSRMAIGKCVEQGFSYTTHIQGGLAAWKAAGLPTKV